MTIGNGLKTKTGVCLKETSDGQQAHSIMCDVTNYRGNTGQEERAVSSHLPGEGAGIRRGGAVPVGQEAEPGPFLVGMQTGAALGKPACKCLKAPET